MSDRDNWKHSTIKTEKHRHSSDLSVNHPVSDTNFGPAERKLRVPTWKL